MADPRSPPQGDFVRNVLKALGNDYKRFLALAEKIIKQMDQNTKAE